MIVRTVVEGRIQPNCTKTCLPWWKCGRPYSRTWGGAVPPTRVLSEQTKTTSILRDLLNEDFNKIVVNDRNIFSDKNYIQRIAPWKSRYRLFYQNGSPIFDSFGITKQVKIFIWKNSQPRQRRLPDYWAHRSFTCYWCKTAVIKV